MRTLAQRRALWWTQDWKLWTRGMPSDSVEQGGWSSSVTRTAAMGSGQLQDCTGSGQQPGSDRRVQQSVFVGAAPPPTPAAEVVPKPRKAPPACCTAQQAPVVQQPAAKTPPAKAQPLSAVQLAEPGAPLQEPSAGSCQQRRVNPTPQVPRRSWTLGQLDSKCWASPIRALQDRQLLLQRALGQPPVVQATSAPTTAVQSSFPPARPARQPGTWITYTDLEKRQNCSRAPPQRS